MGDELEVKVLEVANSGQRVNFSAKQMLDDPLMETLDTIMPVTMPELSFDDSESAFTNGDFDGEEGTKMEASLPGLPRICAELLSEDGVEAVIPGRTAVREKSRFPRSRIMAHQRPSRRRAQFIKREAVDKSKRFTW